MLSEQEFKKKYNYSSATPVIQQYLDNKMQHQDCLLLFRLGDFYELFFEDAQIASNLLSITLTARNKESEEVPMCGVPYHALDAYLYKMVNAGYKIALCEQMENPQDAKKRGHKAVVKREVVRVITAGTIIEENIADATTPNYLVSLVSSSNNLENSLMTICYLDIATNDFGVYSFKSENLSDELEKLRPKELIASQDLISTKGLYERLKPYQKNCVIQANSYFAYNKCINIITKFFNIIDIKAIGQITNDQVSAVGAVLEYINITQKNHLPKLSLPKITSKTTLLLIDHTTRKDLELVSNIQGQYKDSLLSLINDTTTKAGSRLLFKYLSAPLINVDEINNRLSSVEYFVQNRNLTNAISNLLTNYHDVARIVAKISVQRVMPLEIVALKESLKAAFEIKNILINHINSLPAYLQQIIKLLPTNLMLHDTINETLAPAPAKNLLEGGFIASNYHPQILELNNLLDNNQAIILALKNKYQQQTDIDNLKINHNNILGLFVEVSSKNAHKVTDSQFIHRQTMNNTVRFSTEELQKLDQDILSAKTNLIALEQEIFFHLCNKILEHSNLLHDITSSISQVDVFISLAKVAHKYNFVKPILHEDSNFEIIEGWHPIVANNLRFSHEHFVPNDCTLEANKNIWLISGPNMGGKSTFLRQNALIIILAQMGSFVPAKSANIGIVDKLFSRIGANDDISKGRSTFMVEMMETSSILSQATEKSFIILDEVGRGTATYDGVSIAWASLEYISKQINARCLFATHYHELNSLAEEITSIQNYNLALDESGGEIRFLHKIVPGAANKSYGIHVAQIAGMPNAVIARAKQILSFLNTSHNVNNNQIIMPEEIIEAPQTSETLKLLAECNPDALSPKQALEFLYKLKEQL
jgi:DNA mismatch repair protein MutS